MYQLFDMIINKLKKTVNNEYKRSEWIKKRLEEIPHGQKILDAGCGSQQYRVYCNHLKYFAQDFGNFTIDEKKSLTAFVADYKYGKLNYTGNIWEIDEKDSFFDIILCSEVFEHIPWPDRTVMEFSRLLVKGGILLLTVPSNCLRHMDPYFYFSGFSDRYIDFILKQYGFENIQIKPVGSYHEWLMVESFRSIKNGGFFAWMCLFPAFIYHYIKQIRVDESDINTLCMGYHVIAQKK